MRKIAVCLLSGGIDSTVAATHIKNEGYELHLLSIRYGQTLVKELEYAQKIADFLEPAEYKVIDMPGFKDISFSPITGQVPIPENRDLDEVLTQVPIGYPPGRDPFILVLAATWAESLWLADPEGLSEVAIVIGTNKYDSATYPDCKPEVYTAFFDFLKISTKVGRDFRKYIQVKTPLLDKDKSSVVKYGLEIQAPLHLTWSCYKGLDKACGKCDACQLRLQAFETAGVKDPVEYQT